MTTLEPRTFPDGWRAQHEASVDVFVHSPHRFPMNAFCLRAKRFHVATVPTRSMQRVPTAPGRTSACRRSVSQHEQKATSATRQSEKLITL